MNRKLLLAHVKLMAAMRRRDEERSTKRHEKPEHIAFYAGEADAYETILALMEQTEREEGAKG